MFRRTLLIAAMVITPAGLVAAAASGAAAAALPGKAPAACSGVIEITRLAFHPPGVSPGHLSTARLTAVNCTGASQHTSEVWSGRFAGPGTAIPPGCPAIDPISLATNFAPRGHVSSHVGYTVPQSCTATKLRVTVKIDKNGSVLASRTATLKIIQPSPAAAR